MSETGSPGFPINLPPGVSFSNPNAIPPAVPSESSTPQPNQEARQAAADAEQNTGDNNSKTSDSTEATAEQTTHETKAATTAFAGPTISIVNQSTVLSAEEVKTAVAALQIQINRDFDPVWNANARLRIVDDPAHAGGHDWIIYLLDNSDQADALGYHDMTDQGKPVAKIFVKTDQENNLSWTVTSSHEILEMLMDPYITTTAFDQISNTAGRLYAYEMCDPCEEDSMGYEIDGVLVSDFVYPGWFEPGRAAGTRVDHTKKLSGAFSIGEGGYASVFPIPNNKGWVQVYSRTIGKRLELKLLRGNSRTIRRNIGGSGKRLSRGEGYVGEVCMEVQEFDHDYGDSKAKP